MFEVLGSWTFNQRMMEGGFPTIDLAGTASTSGSGAHRKLIEMSTMEVTAAMIAKQDVILADLMRQTEKCGNACSCCNRERKKSRTLKKNGVVDALWHAMGGGRVLLEDLPAKMRSATTIHDLFETKPSSTRQPNTNEPELKDVKMIVLQLLATGILDTSFTVDQKGKVSVHCMMSFNKKRVPLHADQRYWEGIKCAPESE